MGRRERGRDARGGGRWLRHFERLDPDAFRRSVGFTLVGENALGLSMSPEVRAQVNDLTRSLSTPGVAIVLETNGFAMAAARTIVGGLILLGAQGKMRVFASMPDAASWLSDVSCKMGGAVVRKDLLAQAIAQADAAIRAS